MNTKKNILFVMPNLKTGGITSAFLNLLDELRNSKLKIDVLCFDSDDVNLLPSYVNILPSNKFLRILTVNQMVINKESKILGLFRLFCGAITNLLGQGLVYKILMLSYRKTKKYDVAISFSQTANNSLFGGCNEFVLQRSVASEKISFLHCDYQKSGLDTPYSKKIYNQFDKIAAVSDGVKNLFIKCRPELKNKVFTVYNCHQFESIKNLSQKGSIKYQSDVLNFVTVARLSKEKGHERMLSVFKKLKDAGYNFCWHIIGGGTQDFVNDFTYKINEYKLSENVVMHGKQDNPYKYMLNADVLLVPSFHEAAPMVYSEALCLCIPIVSTNTLSADEFITKNSFGLVCDNNECSLFSSVKSIIDNPLLLDKYKTAIKSLFDTTNNTALNQFYKLLGSEFYEWYGHNS